MAAGDYAVRVETQSRDEVGELARAFNRMATDLATVDQQRRDLVATVSHELRTPLTGLVALLENIADGGRHTVGALLLVEVLLIVQVVVAVVAPLAGNPPTGDLLEFWVYLVAAVLLPIGGVAWALLERGRWSTVVLGVVGLSLAIMIWRMQAIWTVQIA